MQRALAIIVLDGFGACATLMRKSCSPPPTYLTPGIE